MRLTENLNGIWDFSYFGDDKPGYPFATTEVLCVPGCYDLMEPYCGKRGYAVYKRQVFTGGLVDLFIDGAGLDGEVFCDGKSVGVLKYAYLPEHIIFDAGKEGCHEIAIVLCNKYNEVFEPYFDFHGYGGIYGDVTLTRIPADYIHSVMISTEDYLTGKLRVRASAANNFSGKAELIFDTGYSTCAEFADGAMDVEVTLPEFKLWSEKTPNLHTLTIKTATDEVTETFGIRQIKLDGRNILINGEKIKLVGFNRHESHPEIGAAMPPQLIAADLRMLKNGGFNYIRGSHYAQRKTMLDLCDKMGIYVWEETLGWDFKAPKLHSPEFQAAQLDQAGKLTVSSFNHPCIIIKGYLNENESEKEETRVIIKAVYDKIRSIDPHTPITFASNRYEKCVCTDIVDIVAMNPYPGWYDSKHGCTSTNDNVKPRLKELSEAMPKDKPFLITEIGAEALLGFRDPLKTYWSEEYQAELLKECVEYALDNDDCAGISIWHFADTRSYVSGPHIFGRARGFNNKGILSEYRQPKMAWYTVKELLKNKKAK
ncbi:MAG: hypothetical protein E7050_00565 [Lentisphaerae bacterium]|nr:hypothetical protein [Lentisphaerota bacterium]